MSVGTGDAGEFTIEYFLTDTYYPDTVGGKITVLGSDSVNYLQSGQKRESSDIKLFTIPDNLPSGTYWIGVFIDSQNMIEETNENNNVKYEDVMVLVE